MFEILEVEQGAVSFADEAAALTEGFPRGYGVLGDQLKRAALSIATDLAEGNSRFTRAHRKNSFTIARGSVQECAPLLEVAHRRALLHEGHHSKLRQGPGTMGNMISGLVKGLKKLL